MHGVYDERGQPVFASDSELQAFAYALARQRAGKLVTLIMHDGAEVVFTPHLANAARAETAIEYLARTNAVVGAEMKKDTPTTARVTLLQHLIKSVKT